MTDTPEDIARDVQAVGQLQAVPSLLRVLRESTGMGFAAVARVSDQTWTACVIDDSLEFGLVPGGQLDLHTTLCKEVRQDGVPVVIDHASRDPRYCNHHTPRTYNIESYISVPIVLPGGRYFGNLCAIDPKPHQLSAPHVVSMFNHFAYIIGLQLESELKHQKEHSALLDERATSELREQFIAVLGHDLRNPLAAISVSGELLLRKLTDPDLTAVAGRIKSNARRMSALIDDVLDFARGRLGGGLGVELQEIDDIDLALTSVVRELQDSQPDRMITTDIRVARRVRCDLVRIQQLMSNLVANALTHGAGTSPVSVIARVIATELVLEVWNDGEPIPADKIDQIFRPFWRHSAADSRQGLGLGLYICSEIVRVHGGILSVASSREIGTRFTARIPLGVQSHGAVESSRKHGSQQVFS
jgi:signal transduction histidine kinase